MKTRLLYLISVIPILTDWLETGKNPSTTRELITEIILCPLLFGLAWWIVQQHEQIAEAAERDSLTGLYNLRKFKAGLATEMGRAAREKGRLCLAYFDLDGFKGINDHFGHETGDRVLKGFAQTLDRLFQGRANCYRLGGDEFAVLGPGMDRGEVARATERLRDLVQLPPLALKSYGADFSVGMAEFVDGQDCEEFIRRADMEMYAKKKWQKGQGIAPAA